MGDLALCILRGGGGMSNWGCLLCSGAHSPVLALAPAFPGLPDLESWTVTNGPSCRTIKQLLPGERAALRLLLSQSLSHPDEACAGNAVSFSKPLHLGQTHLPLEKHVGQSRTLILHPSHWDSQLDTCPELRAWGWFPRPWTQWSFSYGMF